MNKGFCCIGLFNPKSPENVGSVMRAAGCYGVNSVFYTGVRYDREFLRMVVIFESIFSALMSSVTAT